MIENSQDERSLASLLLNRSVRSRGHGARSFVARAVLHVQLTGPSAERNVGFSSVSLRSPPLCSSPHSSRLVCPHSIQPPPRRNTTLFAAPLARHSPPAVCRADPIRRRRTVGLFLARFSFPFSFSSFLMYTTRRINPKAPGPSEGFLTVNDAYDKPRNSDPRSKGRQFQTNPPKAGQQEGYFAKFEYVVDNYQGQ